MNNLASSFQVYWNIRWLRRIVISAMVLLVILILLPVAIQFTLAYVLEKQGATSVQIEDVNFNPFAGTFEIHQLQVSTGDQPPARLQSVTIDINMLDLLSSRVVIDQALIRGMQTRIQRSETGEISINGLSVFNPSAQVDAPVSSEQADAEPIAFAINALQLETIETEYEEPGLKQTGLIQSLHVKDIKSWEPDASASLDMSMLLNQSPIQLSAQLTLFAPVRAINGRLRINNLAIDSFAKFRPQQLSQLQGSVSLDSDFDVKLSPSIQANASTQVSVEKLQIDYQHIRQTIQKVEWQGTTELSEDGALSMMGSLHITNSQTQDTLQNYLVAGFKDLQLTELQYSPDQAQLKQLQISDFKFIDGSLDTGFVKLVGLTLNSLTYEPSSNSLKVEQIQLDQPDIQLAINKQKKLAHLTPLFTTVDQIQVEQTSQEPSAEVERSTAKPLSISIAQFTLPNKGTVSLSDYSVTPSYQTRFNLEKIELNNISTSDPSQFEIDLKQGEYNSIAIRGKGLLFDPAENLEVTANIKQLDLPPVTPYTSNAIGYGMKSGVVDADISASLKQRNIDALIDLKIDSIEVVETQKETAAEVSSASGMSIDLAVSTLKDSKNVIELKLPVKGNIDEPDFDLSLIIRKAMGKAMKSASLTYLKHSLQPFGSLITLFKLAKAAAEHIALPPVLFEINSLAFSDQQEELLGKVIAVLKDRPGLKIKACGISTLSDQQAITEELLQAEKARLQKQGKEADKIVVAEELVQQKLRELGDARSARVKAYFLEQGELESSRILNCLSAVKTEQEAKPSVELLI